MRFRSCGQLGLILDRADMFGAPLDLVEDIRPIVISLFFFVRDMSKPACRNPSYFVCQSLSTFSK